LEHRDKIDTEREDSPLKKADDAILLDNTHFDIEQQFNVAMQYIYGVLHTNPK
jgi:CMP/dCMP kinase